MKVAAVQMCSQDDVAYNLAQAEKLVLDACAGGAAWVTLPEAFAFMGAEKDKSKIAEHLSGDGPIISALRRLAKGQGIYLLAGGLAEVSNDPKRPYNTAVLLSPDGDLICHYRKMHLFDVNLGDGTHLAESLATTAGQKPVVAQVNGLNVGLSICYDLRFPEFFAWQRENDAHVLTVPAAFTETTGQAHWHVLLRARAIETQCYMVAAAQQGRHPLGRRTFGHSMVIDPWGTIIAERDDEGPGVILADLELAHVEKVRQQMPVMEHRHRAFQGR